MGTISFDSLRLKPIGRAPVFFKSAQDMGPQLPGLQGSGGVTNGRPDEMQAPESADQQQFEQDLSTLAFQFVQDRAPALLPYMLGFEVVDRSDDGSKAVGIYGYKIDDDFYYIPVFFINNQIRGVDMILNKRTNSFLPLTENWINYIINRHSVTLGAPAEKGVESTMEAPDLTFLQAPNRHKAASAASDASADPEGMWSLKTAWNVIREQSEKLAASDPLVKEMFNGVLRAVKGAPIKKVAEARYVKGFMRSVGGPEAQVSLLKTFKNVKFANAALTFYEGVKSFDEENVKSAFVHSSKMSAKAAALPKVKVATDLPKIESPTGGGEDYATNSEEDVKNILSHGFTIIDRRDDSEVSDIIDDKVSVDVAKGFYSPSEVGFHSFVMSDGKLREGCLLSLCLNSFGDKSETVAYFPDDRVVASCSVSDMLCDSNGVPGKSYSDLFKSAKPKDEIEPFVGNPYKADKAYLFIGPNGLAMRPVVITGVLKDGDNVSYVYRQDDYSFVVSTTTSRKKYDFGGWDIHDRFHDEDGYRLGGPNEPEPCRSCGTQNVLKFSPEVSRPVVTRDGVTLPDSWKVVEVARCRVDSYDIPSGADDATRERVSREADEKNSKYREMYTFGTATDIMASLVGQGLLRVKIASDGFGEFGIKVDGYGSAASMPYKEAAVTLVTRFGLRPANAFGWLEKASEDGSHTVLVKMRVSIGKEAQAGVGVSMPMPTPQGQSMDPYTGIPMYQDPYIDQQTGQMVGVPSLPPEGGLTRGIADGSEVQRGMGGQDDMPQIDQEAQDLADQAAQAGQRHVFDQAAVGGLSKVYDTSAVVDSYIPNFMDSLDRLGRILFLFYWKHDDFNARYGSDDVVEMEDRLRGVFKQLGDLTLKLKEKAVRSE